MLFCLPLKLTYFSTDLFVICFNIFAFVKKFRFYGNCLEFKMLWFVNDDQSPQFGEIIGTPR